MLNWDSAGNCHFSHFDSCDFCLKLETTVSQAVTSDCHLEEALSYQLRTRATIPPSKPHQCYRPLTASAFVCAHLDSYFMLFLHWIFFLSVTLAAEKLASFLGGTVWRQLEKDFSRFCLFQRRVLDLMKLAGTFNPSFRQMSNTNFKNPYPIVHTSGRDLS